jgi:hypothetical protein
VNDDLVNEIMRVLRGAAEPMPATQICRALNMSDGRAVAQSMHVMYKTGQLHRSANAAGRYLYSLSSVPPTIHAAPAPARAPAGRTTRSLAPPPKPTDGFDAAASISEPRLPSAAEPVPNTTPFKYELYDHIAVALGDAEDLVSDAIERDAPKAVLRHLVAAQVALRRAQEGVLWLQRTGIA